MSATPNAPKLTNPRTKKTPMAEETFDSKLKQMRADLISIVHRMNLDQSEEVAAKAQEALNCVNALTRSFKRSFEELPWDWQPVADAADEAESD